MMPAPVGAGGAKGLGKPMAASSAEPATVGWAGRTWPSSVWASEAGGGEFRPRFQQQRAAIAHVIGDIAEIGAGQDPLILEAVEDDEIEIGDLLLEQLALGEGDERELIERGEVVLVRRPQDGEMHEVDRRVRFQQSGARRALRGRAGPK